MFNALPDFAYMHVDGDAVTGPRFDLVAAHAHDTLTLPVPGSPTIQVPCAHLSLKLVPNAIELGRTPCRHLVPELVRDNERHIVFHADKPSLRGAVIEAVDRLRALGVTMGSPLRPLRIYNRPLAPAPHSQGGDNPYWSKYHRQSHAINVHFDPDTAPQAFRDTLHHELGHATLGHSPVQITSPGGPHDIDQPDHPALAMSEGWGHFVALAIRHERNALPTGYMGRAWERRPPGLPKDRRIETNVALALWDLYDLPGDLPPGSPPLPLAMSPDPVSFSFAQLFEVYSPTLATLPEGPTIGSADEYLRRLKQLQPAQAAGIDRIRQMHFG